LFGLRLVIWVYNTTRKPEKSNGITDRIFPSVIYTDGNNSISKSIGIHRRNKSIGETVGIYRRKYFVSINRRYIPTVLSTGYIARLEICNGVVTSDDFTDGNYRGIQTEIVVQWRGTFTDGITDGIIHRWFRWKKPLYAPICRHSLPLFLLLLLSHPTSALPNCSSPPKL